MPRPERPVPGDGPLADLARALRKLRGRAGRTYRGLVADSNYSRAQLAAAASGTSLPTLEVVMAYARACKATTQDRTELRALWDRADAARTGRGCVRSGQQHAEEAKLLSADRLVQALDPLSERPEPIAAELPHWDQPRPELAHTAEQYIRQLRALRAWAGNPGHKQVVRRSGNRAVAASSMYDALSPARTMLPPLDTVVAIVRACAPGSVRDWAGTWQAISLREFEAANPMPPGLLERRPRLRAVD